MLVCATTSMSMVPYFGDEGLLGTSDDVSIAFALLFIFIMICYVGFVAYFVCCKSKQLVLCHMALEAEHKLALAENFVDDSLL